MTSCEFCINTDDQGMFCKAESMSEPSHILVNIVSLPIEVLQNIYFYAECPQLSHVCRRFRNVLPSFTAYTTLKAERAFSLNPLQSEKIMKDFLDDYPSWNNQTMDLGSASERALEDEVTEDQGLTQGLICGNWINCEMLRKTRSRLVLTTVERIYRLAGANLSSATRFSLNEFLTVIQHEPFVPVMRDCHRPSLPRIGKTWADSLVTNKYSYKVVIAGHLVLVYLESTHCLGLILQPFMPVQNLFHWIGPQVARFDERSQLLLQNLLPVRLNVIHDRGGLTGPWQSLGPNWLAGRTCIDDGADFNQYITKTLDTIRDTGPDVSVDLKAKCLHTLLTLAAPRQLHTNSARTHTLPSTERHTTRPEDRPIFIDHSHYYYAITERNVLGFEILLDHNIRLYNPSIHELKEMMWRALLGHEQGSLFPPCPSPRRLHVETNSLMEQAKVASKPEYFEMMTMVYRKARQLGYQLPDDFGNHNEVQSLKLFYDHERPRLFNIFDDSSRKRKR